MIKLCENCKHSAPRGDFYCGRETSKSLVCGEIITNWRLCYMERRADWFSAYFFNYCGRIGRFWEKKE